MTRSTSSVRTTLAVLVVLAAGLAVPAGAAPVKKVFLESLLPSVLAPSTPVKVDVTLTNDPKSSQTFGSAEILIPTGYRATAVAPPDVGNFQARITTTPLGEPVVLVTSTGPSTSGISAGNALHVSITVTTPASSCNAAWTTYVKQSNDFSGAGNEFLPGEPAFPTTTVGTGTLTFDTQPSDTQYNKAMLPAPVVSLSDPCGAPTSTSGGTVTLTVTGDAALASPPVTAPLMNGRATFSTLTFTSYGSTDTLTASSPGYAAVDSKSFDVVQSLTPCPAGAGCSTGPISDLDGKTFVSITADAGADADVLTATVKGKPEPMFGTCGQPAAGAEPPLGRVVTFNVRSRTKHVVMTLPKSEVNLISNNGTPFMDICLDVPTSGAQFVDKLNQPTWTGLLPNCAIPKVVPCITDRRKRGGDELIGFDLPVGDPHGSWY